MKYRKIFKVEAEGDTLYINAGSLTQAKARLLKMVGPIPVHMLTWTEVDALPNGRRVPVTIKERLDEARGLLRDMESDLNQLDSLNGARNPERSAEILDNLLFNLIHEYRYHLTHLSGHYERQLRKKI